METVIKTIALLVEALGILLLFREVRRGHWGEGLAGQFEYELEMLALIDAGQLREAREMEMRWRGYPEEEIQERSARWSPESLAGWKILTLEGTAPAGRVKAVKRLGESKNVKRRRLLVTLGTLLVLLALLLEGVDILVSRSTHNVADQTSGGEGGAVEASGRPPTWQVFEVEPPIAFGSGRGTLTYRDDHGQQVNLHPLVCDAKNALRARQSTVALVVGRHDQNTLRATARRTYADNSGLAQRRAEEVAAILRTSTECGTGIATVIALSGSPVNVGVAAMKEPLLARDRIVEVYGLGPQTEKTNLQPGGQTR